MMVKKKKSKVYKPARQSVFWMLVFILLNAIYSLSPAFAFDPENDVPIDFIASATGIHPGGKLDLAVIFHVPEDYHITSRETGLFFVEFDSIPGFTFTEPQYPEGVLWQEDEVYSGDVVVTTSMQASSEVQPGELTINVLVGHQVCVETGSPQCFFPVEKELSLALNVLDAEEEVEAINSEIFGIIPTQAEVIPEVPKTDLAGSLENALARGSLLALLLVFVGGILTSFTPCVYPIIPMTVSYIGAKAEGKKLKGFILSLFFVLGLATMYSSLGVIAALSGGVFGGLTQHPVVYGILIAIFLVMGASMMGAFDIQLPASFQGKLQSGKRKGIVGAILMGMAAGLIAAPCVGPVLVALLTWVAKTGSVLIGFGLLFTFSLGMGLLFVVIGTFAGSISALPQAGGWMEGVKHFFGWLLWGTAVYFAGVLLPDNVMTFVWAAFLSLLGIYIGAFRLSPDEVSWNWVLRKWIGILAVTAGIFFFVFGLTQSVGWQLPQGSASGQVEQTEPDWIINDIEGAFAQSKAEGKPLMMDFYADWCVACVELDHKTYNKPEVLSRAARFVNLKVDFTRQNKWSKQITGEYKVKGMPTVIFFNPAGAELERFVGFKNAEGVAEIMDRVLQSSP